MFARPKGIGVDSEGHIYVVDAAFNNVQIFNDEGQVLLAFASYGSDRSQMILPAGLAVDSQDYIYVVDSWNRRVNMFEYVGAKAESKGSAGPCKEVTKLKSRAAPPGAALFKPPSTPLQLKIINFPVDNF